VSKIRIKLIIDRYENTQNKHIRVGPIATFLIKILKSFLERIFKVCKQRVFFIFLLTNSFAASRFCEDRFTITSENFFSKCIKMDETKVYGIGLQRCRL